MNEEKGNVIIVFDWLRTTVVAKYEIAVDVVMFKHKLAGPVWLQSLSRP